MAATYQVNLSESMKVLWLCSNSDPSKVESKQFMKQWVVLSSNLPGEGSLHFYSSKAAVLHDPAVNVETLSGMINVCHLGYSKKQMILQLSYSDHSILLLFSSVATMKLWQEKLKAFLYCYSLCLLKCPHKPYETGNYIVSYADNSLSVFSARSNDLMWRWNIGHLRRYSYEPKVPFIEIEAGRSSETGEGKFFFSGKRSRHLYSLLESLSFNARSPKQFISSSSSTSASLCVAGSMTRSKSNSIDISSGVEEVISGSVDTARTDDDIPRYDSAGYLTILGPSSVSPMANRKFFIEKKMRVPPRSATRVNGKTGSTTTGENQYGSHRNRHLFTTPTGSLDEQFLNDENEVLFSEPRSHSVPDIKETFHNGGVLQEHKNNKVPYVNVVPIGCSTHEDNIDDDAYINNDDMKVILS